MQRIDEHGAAAPVSFTSSVQRPTTTLKKHTKIAIAAVDTPAGQSHHLAKIICGEAGGPVAFHLS